jgi:transposase
MKMPKQADTTEFKEGAVKRIKDGQSVRMVCKELGLSDQTVRNGVKAAAEGKLSGTGGRGPQRKWHSPGCVPKTYGSSGRTKS